CRPSDPSPPRLRRGLRLRVPKLQRRRQAGTHNNSTPVANEKQPLSWRMTDIGGYGSRLSLAVARLAGTTSRTHEAWRLAKSLASDDRSQPRGPDRGFPAQDHASALRSLHPPPRRLSFWIRQTRAHWRRGCVVQSKGSAVVGVCAW